MLCFSPAAWLENRSWTVIGLCWGWGWNFKHPSCCLGAEQSRGAVRGNHKVLDGWKQLKGFCISAPWLISSMHMSSPTAGRPLRREPPVVSLPPVLSFPQDFHTDYRTPASSLSASVSLNSWARRTDAPWLLTWFSKGAHIKHPGPGLWLKLHCKDGPRLLHFKAAEKGWSEAELTNKEVNGLSRRDIPRVPAVFSWLRASNQRITQL